MNETVSIDAAIAAFPSDAQAAVSTVVENGGVLEAEQVVAATRALRVPVEALMLRLLDVARCYAIVPVSGFHVGAVAKGMPKAGGADLYLGANVEFGHQSLSTSVHGEQCATNNAWINGEEGVSALAISAAPCGYCRQFLYELSTSMALDVVLKQDAAPGYQTHALTYYLPDAFGPKDLGQQAGWMAPETADRHLALADGAGGELAECALEAANRSYAPYTQGFAGCAIRLADGAVYAGRYAENAAYNPSLAPLGSAIALMNMRRRPGADRTVVAAALVECDAKSGRRGITEDVLSSFAPDVVLEYHLAV